MFFGVELKKYLSQIEGFNFFQGFRSTILRCTQPGFGHFCRIALNILNALPSPDLVLVGWVWIGRIEIRNEVYTLRTDRRDLYLVNCGRPDFDQLWNLSDFVFVFILVEILPACIFYEGCCQGLGNMIGCVV